MGSLGETSVATMLMRPGVNDAILEEEIMALCDGRTIDDMLSEVPPSGWCGLDYSADFYGDHSFADVLSPDLSLAFSPDTASTLNSMKPCLYDLDKCNKNVFLTALDTLDSDIEASLPHLDDADLSWSPLFVDDVPDESWLESGDDIDNLCRLAAQSSPGAVPAMSLPLTVQQTTGAQTEEKPAVEAGSERVHVLLKVEKSMSPPASHQLSLPSLCDQHQKADSENRRKRAWSGSTSENACPLSGHDTTAVSHSRTASVTCSPSPSHACSPLPIRSPSPASPHVPSRKPGKRKSRKPLECDTPTNIDARSTGSPGEDVVDLVDLDDAVKRAVRLVRNRASACDSRQRRKEYVKDMETKCKVMEGEVTRLNRMVSTVCMENGFMREQLARLHGYPAPHAPLPGQAPLPAAAFPPWAAAGTAHMVARTPNPAVTPSHEGGGQGEGGMCQRVDGKSGVAEPAVLESDSLPSESLPLSSCPYFAPLLILLCLLLWALTSGQYSPVASLWPAFHLLYLLLATKTKVEGKERNRSSQGLALLLGRLAFEANKKGDGVGVRVGSRRRRLRKKRTGVARVGGTASKNIFRWSDAMGWAVLGFV